MLLLSMLTSVQTAVVLDFNADAEQPLTIIVMITIIEEHNAFQELKVDISYLCLPHSFPGCFTSISILPFLWTSILLSLTFAILQALLLILDTQLRRISLHFLSHFNRSYFISKLNSIRNMLLDPSYLQFLKLGYAWLSIIQYALS